MRAKIEELYKKFQQLTLQTKFQISEIEKILVNKYLARIIETNEMEFLLEPDRIGDFNKCFVIENKDILNNLFTEQEKSDFINIKEINENYPLTPESTEAEIEYTRIQEGEYLVVFLGINDEKYIQNFKLVGNCERMSDELVFLMGMEEKDCNLKNLDFHDYLRALSNLGYL